MDFRSIWICEDMTEPDKYKEEGPGECSLPTRGAGIE